MSRSFLSVDGCFCSMNTSAKTIWNITTFSYYKLTWCSKVDSFIAASTFFENWLESLGKQGYTPFYKNDNNLNFLSRVSDYSYKTVKNHSGDLNSSVSTLKAFPLQVLIMLKIISYSKKMKYKKVIMKLLVRPWIAWYHRCNFMSLTHKMPVFPSYRNQSIDFLCKSIDWFLYEGNTGN